MPGVGKGHNPASHTLDPAKALAGRKKAWEKARKKVDRAVEDLKAGSVPSKFRLLWAQEALARIAGRAEKITEYWSRQKETAKRKLFTQRGLVMRAETDAEEKNWPPEERQRTIGALKAKMLDLKNAFDAVSAEYRSAEAWLLDVLARMGRFAEAAAPYFDPKLAATDIRVAKTETNVNVNVTAEAADILAVCGDALREIVAGRIVAEPRRLQADSLEQPLDSPTPNEETGDIPPGG